MRVLVTGAAGFIGGELCLALLGRHFEVFGIDNLNSYYDVNLKLARLERVRSLPGFQFEVCDISDMKHLSEIFCRFSPDVVVNLAAQAGVRYSITDPESYTKSNLVGFANVLECCRRNSVQHLVFASSSSVYGECKKVPFNEEDRVDNPVSYYAATKKANELMAASYANLYGMQVTGLRFFTVYGPWGRPDMAAWLFTSAILSGRPIKIFNQGRMKRDFTYISDIVEGVCRIIEKKDLLDAKYNIFNIGNNHPVELADFIRAIEEACGKEAKKEYLPMQNGDVTTTYADISKLYKFVQYKPSTGLSQGVGNFVRWYREYHNI